VAFVDWCLPQDEIMCRTARDRRRGYREALVAEGLTQRSHDIWMLPFPAPGTNPVGEFRTHLRRWLGDADRPTAVVAPGDTWVMTLMRLAEELGITVPGDLELASFDGTIPQGSAGPRFTTTTPDFVRVGETAVHVLLQHLHGEIESPVHYVHPAPLRARDTAEKRDMEIL
jgi:LacI family transcriptional regulator